RGRETDEAPEWRACAKSPTRRKRILHPDLTPLPLPLTTCHNRINQLSFSAVATMEYEESETEALLGSRNSDARSGAPPSSTSSSVSNGGSTRVGGVLRHLRLPLSSRSNDTIPLTNVTERTARGPVATPQHYQYMGVQRTNSFPNDLYSGSRYSRFEMEEALRQRNGTSIKEWLDGKRKQLQAARQAGLDDDERDRDKQMKAQHLESFDYDFFESRVNMQHDHEQTEEAIRSLNLGRWIMTFSIGLMTALVACFVETMTGTFSSLRTTTMEATVAKEKSGHAAFGQGFLVYAAISVGYVSIASYCVAILCPVAGGSGISEIKATLNGIKIHRVVRLKTLFCKAFGILFSVAGGLPVGKEGPMIHSGAVIGAGLSQGKSSSFGVDTSWTKFKGFRNDKEKRDFISCGAAAGVAAAFGAPIGGVLFALEEGASFWHQNLTWRTFFCAMVSAFVFNFFISYMDNEAEAPDGRVFIGTLGQTGTFSFGPFVGNKSYDVLDLIFFIGMGMVGGLFGAMFNAVNTHLTRFRQRWMSNRWVKLSEALFIALTMASLSFWLSYHFGECRKVGGKYSDSLVNFYCPDGEFNDLASLFTVSYSTSIKQLLHFNGDASFSAQSLIIFFVVFYIMACWTYGIAVPSGLFVPSLLAGAAYGRLCVMMAHHMQLPVGAPDGMFALIGAASMLGGMARMTISLTVIILECTGVIEWGLPIMVSLMAARWIGNSFNEGLYDIHIHLKKLPFLEFDPPFYSRFLRVQNIMGEPPLTVDQIVKAGEILDILKNCNHGGFPVVIPRKPSDKDAKLKPPKFVGIINRRHLCVLLQRKDFFVDKPTPFTRKPAGETTLLYNDQYALSYRDIESNYPRYPTIQEIKLDEDERDLWMDLTPYMNPTPHTVQEQTPVPRAFRLFRSLGLRHLVVLNRRNEVRGMITRKDLTPSHLKECLEALSESEKMRIQGYFNRGRSASQHFEEVERTLLNIVDNSRMTMTDGGGYGTAFGASAGASGGMRNLRSGRTMLTRSRARDTNQPVFVDDQWNDADPWPLQSRSALVAVCKALLNAVTLVVISSLVTRAFCARSVRWPLHAVPSPASWFTSIHQLHWNGCVRRAARRWAQCLSSVSDDNGLEAIGIDCMQPFFHGMALTLGLVATLQFHRLWLKTLLLGGLALTAAVHTATNLRSAQRTAVHIYSLDPSFAYANETIFIAIDGLNMEEGGRIAWAPYWDGARTKKLADTPKVLSRPLHHGGVTVAFTQLDDYIPCYRPPSRSRGRSTEKYECFEHVRLRIKDRRSVPGWSLQHHHDGEEDEEHTAHENAKHAL
ncbi:TPA: hypothetical protein N0F65_010786, partial [Lagenidium giganteum]